MQTLLTRIEIPNDLISPQNSKIICYYKNTTSKLQITRISNFPNWYFEQVIFPGQQILFEALPEAELEIHTATQAGTTLVDKISCSRLQVRS